MSIVHSMLSSQSNVKQRKVVLKLLAAIVFLDGNLEKLNREETKKDYVIKRLCLAAKRSTDKECAKRVMEKLMSNHVGTFYSWQGSAGKKDSFKNTIMMETVRRKYLIILIVMFIFTLPMSPKLFFIFRSCNKETSP
ncbi:hypothetical protein DMN91_002922 [Ooceraea biroi]|uniref:Uncharacterized protein n=1 Tax=Ooceraea biroi TaxID=2015173 RepID=A0A3L8DX07_OOCBI|nr:hypothetical protein DMN91_002922 [Ooceraea biroi]